MIVVIAQLFIWGCTNTVDSEAGNPGITTAGLISMPTSIAQSSSNRAAKDNINELYSYILDQNYFVNELINGNHDASVKSLLEEMATLPWKFIVKWGNYDTTIGTQRFTMTYSENSELPYYVLISDTIPGAAWKISAQVNGETDLIKGKVNYFIENPEDIFAESLCINLDFNKVSDYRTLNIKITQKLNPNDTNFNGDEGQSWDYSLYEKDGILNISSGSYHPYLPAFNNDNAELCYIYTTVADTIANLAKVNLSLAPSDYNGTDSATLFGTYGTSEAYSGYIIDAIQNEKDSIKTLIASSYKDTLPLDSVIYKILFDPTYTPHSPSEVFSMNSSDLILFLQVNESLDDEDFLTEELLWLTMIAQPVFFDENGYADNGTTFKSKFNSIAAEPYIGTPKNPASLKIQSLDFE